MPPQYWIVSGGPLMGHQSTPAGRTSSIGKDMPSCLYSNCTVLCLGRIHSHSVTSLSRGTIQQSTILAARPACSRSHVVMLTAFHSLSYFTAGRSSNVFTAGRSTNFSQRVLLGFFHIGDSMQSSIFFSFFVFFFFFFFFFFFYFSRSRPPSPSATSPAQNLRCFSRLLHILLPLGAVASRTV